MSVGPAYDYTKPWPPKQPDEIRWGVDRGAIHVGPVYAEGPPAGPDDLVGEHGLRRRVSLWWYDRDPDAFKALGCDHGLTEVCPACHSLLHLRRLVLTPEALRWLAVRLVNEAAGRHMFSRWQWYRLHLAYFWNDVRCYYKAVIRSPIGATDGPPPPDSPSTNRKV